MKKENRKRTSPQTTPSTPAILQHTLPTAVVSHKNSPIPAFSLVVSVFLLNSKRVETDLSRQRLTRVQLDRLLIRLLGLDRAGEVELSEGEEDSAMSVLKSFKIEVGTHSL